ncbi:hypothetical protein F3Y22_tig00000765pilonHSYRG00018 [Hibiscus syriacus]|uniref:RRM domain-containing protein n=1 Tax=Hibiscus syriacus TaxID=106335 RepID=A0A6A3CXR8_HIBSY|nr:hypothetical protein F3Y22_tig00000765pilonHSYRG00018 [Hibiscus syriacus]
MGERVRARALEKSKSQSSSDEIWTSFVDNLSWRVSRSALRELFQYHGSLENEKSMMNAIAKVNGSLIDGREVSLGVAKYQKPRRGSAITETDWMKSSLTGVIKAFVDLELESFLQRLAESWGTLVEILEATRNIEDMSVASLMIRVASPFDVPKMITLGAYGRSFKTEESSEDNQDGGRKVVLVEGDGKSNDESRNRVVAWLADGRTNGASEERGDGSGGMEEIESFPKSGGEDGLKESSGSPLLDDCNTSVRSEANGRVKKRLFERVYRRGMGRKEKALLRKLGGRKLKGLVLSPSEGAAGGLISIWDEDWFEIEQ